jgi:hypothetical protein
MIVYFLHGELASVVLAVVAGLRFILSCGYL